MFQIIFQTILCAAISLEWIIRIVVSNCSLLNEKSHKICREDSLSGKKNMFYKNVIGNNLMMTLYFSCLLECAELLIDIFSLAAFLNILFQRWPWKIGSNTWFLFHCIFWIFLFLNLSTISIIIKTLYHTYSLQLVCDKVAFTLKFI